jgi:hypothetical protein
MIVGFAFVASCFASGLMLSTLTVCELENCKLLNFGPSYIYASDVYNFFGIGIFLGAFAFALTLVPVIFLLFYAENAGVRAPTFYVVSGGALGVLVTYLPSETLLRLS